MTEFEFLKARLDVQKEMIDTNVEAIKGIFEQDRQSREIFNEIDKRLRLTHEMIQNIETRLRVVEDIYETLAQQILHVTTSPPFVETEQDPPPKEPYTTCKTIPTDNQ